MNEMVRQGRWFSVRLEETSVRNKRSENKREVAEGAWVSKKIKKMNEERAQRY